MAFDAHAPPLPRGRLNGSVALARLSPARGARGGSRARRLGLDAAGAGRGPRRRRGRQQRVFEALAAALAVVYTTWAIGALGGGWAAATATLTALVLTGAVIGVRRGVWTRAGVGGWLVGALWAILSAVVFATGGLGLAAPFALVLVPMLAVLLVGPRAGIAWTGVILAEVALLAVLHGEGFAFPHRAAGGSWRYIVGLAAVIALLAGAGILAHRRSAALVADLNRARITLEATRRRAREAGQAKSRFLAGMSHELRTPMTGVLGMIDALRDEPLDRDQRETLDKAEVSARTLLDLINAIIDLSRAESRELLEAAPFSLRALVEARLDAIRPAMAARRVAVEARFAPDAPDWVIGDEFRVAQVLGVLLDNAAAYTRAGAISVTVEPRAGVRLVVLDTGAGIPPDRQVSIFDPFSRGQGGLPGRRRPRARDRTAPRPAHGRRPRRRERRRRRQRVRARPPAARGRGARNSLPPVDVEGEARAVAGLRVLVVDDNAVNRAVSSACCAASAAWPPPSPTARPVSPPRAPGATTSCSWTCRCPASTASKPRDGSARPVIERPSSR
ncbi:MAG: HAMP domain-containing histidine kinase [Myxococcales bacterium]|nr:HAMP domain-containing histidine kinase [Myxococcales bacterium]